MHQSLKKTAGPVYLLSGQLRLGAVPKRPAAEAALGRGGGPAGSILIGPAFIEHVPGEAMCLQDAQVSWQPLLSTLVPA